MRGIKGFMAGFLGLIALGAVLSAEQRRPGRATGIIDVLTNGLARLVDPNVPAIADRRRAGAGAGAASGGAGPNPRAVGAQIAQIPSAIFGPVGSTDSRRRVPGQAQP